jgi:hypothetical protein
VGTIFRNVERGADGIVYISGHEALFTPLYRIGGEYGFWVSVARSRLASKPTALTVKYPLFKCKDGLPDIDSVGSVLPDHAKLQKPPP